MRQIAGSGCDKGQSNARRVVRRGLLAFSFLLFFTAMGYGQMLVDCTGTNTSAYKTITAALNAAPHTGATILVTGPCTENVGIWSWSNLHLGAAVGGSVTLTGSLTVDDSTSVYLYGLNVTNASGTGISISSSSGVTLEKCTSNGNASDGMDVGPMADVSLIGVTSFDSNKRYGLSLSAHAHVCLCNWSSGYTTDVSNNAEDGVWMTQESVMEGDGPLTVESNGIGATPKPGAVFGFGIVIYGASSLQLGDCMGSTTVKDNVSGGVSVQENSQYSLWACESNYAHTIESNGPVGILVGLGGEATIETEVQISGHQGPAVSVGSNSVFYSLGPVIYSQNGSPGVSRGAAIDVSAGSHAVFSGGQVSATIGPAILAELGSTVNFSGMTFTGVGGGVIQCDSTSYMWTDLTGTNQGRSMGCTVPSPAHGQPIQHLQPMLQLQRTMPDRRVIMARQAEYRRLASGKVAIGHLQNKP